MAPFQPKAGEAAWKTIYHHLAGLKVDDILTHQRLKDLVPHIVGPESALHRAIEELQDKDKRTVDNIRGVGWRIVHAREHAGIAKRGREQAARQLDRSRDIVANTRVEDLTSAERDIHRTVLDGLTFLATVVRKHESDIEKLRRRQDEDREHVGGRLARIEQMLGVKAGQVIDADTEPADEEEEPAADPAKVRAWAAANGYTVADRGRIPRDIVDAYHQAHG